MTTTTNNKLSLRKLLGASLLAALAGSPAAWAQQEQGRVISSTPIRTGDGVAGYSVTYEYAGRQYSTRTDSPPGDFIAVQVTPMGVMTSQQQQEQQPQYEAEAPAANNSSSEPWRNVTPEPGVVISGGSVTPAPIPAPQVVYQGAPAVVYAAPPPVYVAPGYGYGGYGGYGYGYPAYGYGYPPIGLSLNFGYSYSRGYRGYRGWR
ncbi:hypothetical protein ACIPRI_19210 [Variovorax sp. LARHSF232]